MSLDASQCFLIHEVHNYGGFFGGDTITFEAAPFTNLAEAQTIVIDGKDFANVPNRHNILANMVLELHMTGERVDVARLVAAPSHEELRTALELPTLPATINEPLTLSARCPKCNRWVLAELWHDSECEICSLGVKG